MNNSMLASIDEIPRAVTPNTLLNELEDMSFDIEMDQAQAPHPCQYPPFPSFMPAPLIQPPSDELPFSFSILHSGTRAMSLPNLSCSIENPLELPAPQARRSSLRSGSLASISTSMTGSFANASLASATDSSNCSSASPIFRDPNSPVLALTLHHGRNDSIASIDSGYADDNQFVNYNADVKRQRTLARNRENARRCRKKKQDKIKQLESEVLALQMENVALKEQVAGIYTRF
jgi:bZIP transcription factor